jgi:hypothetical protein
MATGELTTPAVRSYWSNEDGYLVSGWELAIAWDDGGKPTAWRPLDPANPEDERLLWALGLT